MLSHEFVFLITCFRRCQHSQTACHKHIAERFTTQPLHSLSQSKCNLLNITCIAPFLTREKITKTMCAASCWCECTVKGSYKRWIHNKGLYMHLKCLFFSSAACLRQSAARKRSWSSSRLLPPMVSWLLRASSPQWRTSPQKTPMRWEKRAPQCTVLKLFFFTSNW